MKKFTSICLIISCIVFCIGIIFVIVGAGFGGVSAFRNMLYNNAFSINSKTYHFLDDDNFTSSTEDTSSFQPSDDSSEAFGDNTFNGSFAQKSFSLRDVSNLDLQVTYGEVYLTTSDDINDIQVSAKNIDSTYLSDAKSGTLSIKSDRKSPRHLKFKSLDELNQYDKHHPIITIQIPSNTTFTNTTVQMNAGYMKLDELNADTLNLELNAGLCVVKSLNITSSASMNIDTGKLEVQDGSLSNLDLSFGAGQADITSDLTGKTTLDCSVGEILLKTKGMQKDFNYDISCNVGSIDIDGSTYSGLNLSKSIDNGASKSFDLTCSVGHIKVSFS